LHMFTRGYAKHPCTQLACGQGFAVGTSQRYRCRHIRIEGDPLYPKNQNLNIN
jgi:hypothetical protein